MGKPGKLSNLDIDYIKSNASLRSYVEIAKDLNRNPETIKKALDKLGLKSDLSTGTFNPMYVSRLKDKPFFSVLQEQFSEAELEFFENEWNTIHEQFKDDVLPTEELQIIDTIKIGILMNRNLKLQKSAQLDMQLLDDQLEIELKLDEDLRDTAKMDMLRQQKSFLMAGQSSLGKDFKELVDRKNKMFENLKATRRDRISRIESSRESFLSWMSEIVNNPDRRRELGMQMEKMRLAAINETVRLAAYHKYDDGEVDQPLLSADTVKTDNTRNNNA